MILRLLPAGTRAKIKSGLLERLTRQPGLEARTLRRARAFGIQTLLDVGANHGQYAQRVRALGWQGALHSFEPLNDPLRSLTALAAKDPHHHVHPVALGAEAGQMQINVASNQGASSSMLPMREDMAAQLGINTVEQVAIEVRRLDKMLDDLGLRGRPLMLKIDTQGFERNVLEGAGAALEDVALIFLEVSLVSIYEGEPLLLEMMKFLDGMGYVCGDMEPSVWVEPSKPLQCDLLCLRKDLT